MYTYRTHKLINFLKNIKTLTHSLSILLYIYKKIQVQISRNKVTIEMIKFLIDLNS
jgi:hypothetical protein